tara:strand:- start:44 stop:217 length:174 start_codon:yes stop_codon:yes gene_type:complete
MAERQATTSNNKQQQATTSNNKQQQTNTSYQLFGGFHGHGVKIFVRRVHQFVVVETQ